MFRKHWLSAYRALVLLAVLTSALLFIHYLAPAESEFCGTTGGCEAVRKSGHGYFFGSTYLNIPLVGMVAYSAMLIIAWGKPSASRLNLVRGLASLGAVGAISFILWQALGLKAYCWMCMVVDCAAIAAAFCAIAAHGAADEQIDALPGWTWGWLLFSLIMLPIAWFSVRPPPPVPRQVSELYQPNKINVIEFADFQCPFCRRVHPMLKELMQEYGDRVAFKRMHMPLEMHALAADAARVAVCAAKQGQEAAMADLLFEGKLDDESYAAYAAELKLDTKLFDACRADPATQAAIDSDIARFRESGLHGLPTTYIGDERITGARPMATFKEAFERAATAHAGLQPSGGLFLTFSVLIVAGLLGAGHLAQRRSAS